MADTKLSALTAATPAAGDLVYLVQGGNSRRATAQGIANLAPATNLAYDSTSRVLSSSTGDDATLPLASTTLPGLLSAVDKVKLDGGQAQTVTVTVRNNTASTIGKGVPVYVTGSSGTTITIAPADASAEATAAETLGLTAASIASNADGTVIAVGELTGINTAALTEGQIIWLSETTGSLTTTRPTQPAHGVVIGYCVKQAAGTAGIVYVKIDNGLELAELHDVLVTGAAAGQFLQLAADGLWKPRTFVAADISNSTTAGRALLTAADAAAQRTSLGLGTAAPLDVPAAGDASASQVVKGSDTRLSDAREWSAATITQAEAEAGVGTTRRAFTAQRVFQAAAAWWAATASATGQALATAATAAAARTTLGLGTASTHDVAAAGDASASQVVKGNDTRLSDARTPTAHNQAASTITGLATVATSGAYSDLTGRPTLFDAASPGAIGGTTPAAGSFTSLTASTRLGLPSGAPASPVARDLYAISDTLRYRDSGGTERLILNATDNLSNLASAATARTNLGLGSAATAATSDFLPTTFTASTITYAASVALDMSALAGGYRTISLTGDLTFTTSNRASGRQVTLRLICDATQRTLTFPAGWVFIGTKPSTIAASKTAVLSLTFFGTADTDCVAAYGVQS